MASFVCKKNKDDSACDLQSGSGSTDNSAPSSPASSVQLVSQSAPEPPSTPNSVINNNNNAPKYGTLVPNRIFVGGISGTTTETELAQLFSAYGNVKATKVISDRAGVSKGYGFVTFETEEEAKRLMNESDNITLKERKLNIAPAIKKQVGMQQQQFTRPYEAASPPTVANTALFYQNGVPYTFHNGMAYFTAGPAANAGTPGPMNGAGEATVYSTASYQQPAPTAQYPLMYPCATQPLYMPQQYPFQPLPPPSQPSQYVYSTTASAGASTPGGMAPNCQGSPLMAATAPGTPSGSSMQMTTLPQYYPAQEMYYNMGTPQAYPMIPGETLMYDTPTNTETSSSQSAEDSGSNSGSSDVARRAIVVPPATSPPVVSLLNLTGEGLELPRRPQAPMQCCRPAHPSLGQPVFLPRPFPSHLPPPLPIIPPFPGKLLLDGERHGPKRFSGAGGGGGRGYQINGGYRSRDAPSPRPPSHPRAPSPRPQVFNRNQPQNYSYVSSSAPRSRGSRRSSGPGRGGKYRNMNGIQPLGAQDMTDTNAAMTEACHQIQAMVL